MRSLREVRHRRLVGRDLLQRAHAECIKSADGERRESDGVDSAGELGETDGVDSAGELSDGDCVVSDPQLCMYRKLRLYDKLQRP